MNNISYESYAPVSATCPDINAVQSEIETIISDIEWAIESIEKKTESNEDIQCYEEIKELRKVIQNLKGIKNSFLENLRDSNSKLREWGKDLVVACKEFDKQCTKYEDKISDLENANDTLKSDLASYEVLESYKNT